MNIITKDYNSSKYFVVSYYLESSNSLLDAALQLAIGQSFGNPNVRSNHETDELIAKHSCLIIEDEETLKKKKNGFVRIAFPLINTDIFEDGISHVLCQIMGGQLDINSITKCHALDISFPEHFESQFPKPKYGISGMRNYVQVYDKPFVGAIIKPKTGFNIGTYEQMLSELISGGVNFIKEDEIIADPVFCRLEERVKAVKRVRGDSKVIICHTINADPIKILDKAKMVADLGGNGVHINIWSGLGSYLSVRQLDLPLFIHYQKSGDAIMTDRNARFFIDWLILCKLAGLSGVDSIHAGMWGGYNNVEENELKYILDTLHRYNVIPALSCGMHPGLIQATVKRFGNDWMANAGGSVHGHPSGSQAGAKALCDAVNNIKSLEYQQAIAKWRLVD